MAIGSQSTTLKRPSQQNFDPIRPQRLLKYQKYPAKWKLFAKLFHDVNPGPITYRWLLFPIKRGHEILPIVSLNFSF